MLGCVNLVEGGGSATVWLVGRSRRDGGQTSVWVGGPTSRPIVLVAGGALLSLPPHGGDQSGLLNVSAGPWDDGLLG